MGMRKAPKKLLKNKLLFGAFFACLVACNANSPENKFLLAERLLEDHKYDAAIEEFQEIVDKAPSSKFGLDAQLKIAQIEHLYLGRSKEAVAAYRDFLKRNKDEAKKKEIERILADLEFQNFEDYEDAAEAYAKLIEKNPDREDTEEIMFRIGRSFFLKSKFQEAVKMYTKQKEQFPRGKFAWKAELEIANSLSSQGKCADAIKQFDKVIDGAPKEQKVLASFGKGICYEEQDDLDSAYEIFSKIKADYPAPSVVELKMQKIKRRKILRKR
jgi:TolA-binding protein